MTKRIRLKKGIKQGDMMSPILFNMAIDPLLYTLEKRGKGFTAAGLEVTSLAFADDLVLLSDSWSGMAENLAMLEKFKLKINPSQYHLLFSRGSVVPSTT